MNLAHVTFAVRHTIADRTYAAGEHAYISAHYARSIVPRGIAQKTTPPDNPAPESPAETPPPEPAPRSQRRASQKAEENE